MLIDYERYLPVLTDEELESLLSADRPSLVKLQDWERRLNNSRARLDVAFASAYKKTKYEIWKMRKTTWLS